MAVIGYARRSREAEVGAYGLDDQEAKVRAWAAYKGKTLDLMIREDDVSGAIPPDERDELGPILEDLGPGDELVVAKFDRLSRSLYDFAGLIRASQGQGWALVCLDPELDLTTGTGKAMAGMLAVFGEFERDQFIGRMIGGREAKRASGKWAGGVAPFGWRVDEVADALVMDETEQKVVRRMRSGRRADWTLREIASSLNADGITTRRGKEWQAATVMRVLDRIPA